MVRPVTSFSAQIPNTTMNATKAIVQFRQTVSMTFNDTPRNFVVLEVIELNFSLIAALLTVYKRCLEFEDNSDKVLFYATYPELR